MEWLSIPYWSYYPKGHPGKGKGSLSPYEGSIYSYRELPENSWNKDKVDFYYTGSKVHPLSKEGRGMKENLIEYELYTENESGLRIHGRGDIACRLFDKDESQGVYLNSDWDYSSLLWGNYDRQSYIEGDYKAEFTFRLLE